MKGLLLLSLFSLSATAAEFKMNDKVKVVEAHCEASSLTGKTKFDFSEGDAETLAITDGVYGRGIETRFTIPSFYVLSPTGDQEPLSYGSSKLSFHVKRDGGPSRFSSYIFVLAEKASEGEKVYNATLMGTSVGGFPFPGKTIYSYVGKGSCVVSLTLRK